MRIHLPFELLQNLTLSPSGFNTHQTAEDWLFVLRISNRFQFFQSSVQPLAIARIKATASTMEKILWGEECGSEALRAAGYREMCLRVECPSFTELEQLSSKTVEIISFGRERFKRASRCKGCTSGGLKLAVTDDELAIHFAKQLRYTE